MAENWIAAGAGRSLRPAPALLSLVVILLLLPSWLRAGADGCDRVVRVYDGDTLLLAEASGRRRLIRMVGIDAPETSKTKGKAGQPFSVRARRHLAGRILDRCVQLEAYGDDRYGRRLAVIHLEGTNINLEMVRLGLAEHYGGRTPEGFDRRPYQEAESDARRNARGMWVQGKHYRSPLDWKHRR